jgi:hypothetical protein
MRPRISTDRSRTECLLAPVLGVKKMGTAARETSGAAVPIFFTQVRLTETRMPME